MQHTTPGLLCNHFTAKIHRPQQSIKIHSPPPQKGLFEFIVDELIDFLVLLVCFVFIGLLVEGVRLQIRVVEFVEHNFMTDRLYSC